MNEKQEIITALYAFVAQRARIEPGNYGDVSSYRAEQRQVTNDRHHAERLIRAVAMRESITADDMKAAFKRAFSGRLSWIPANTQHDHGGSHASVSPFGRLDYCTGQYFPTEYRKAVAAVCSAALWDFWREGANATEEAAKWKAESDIRALTVASSIRKSARKEFGLTIAQRYFDYRPSDYR